MEEEVNMSMTKVERGRQEAEGMEGKRKNKLIYCKRKERRVGRMSGKDTVRRGCEKEERGKT